MKGFKIEKRKNVNNIRKTMINYPLNILKQVRVILPALCKTPARKSQTLVYQEKSVAPEDTYVDVCKNAHLRYIVETGAKKT